MSDHQFNPPPEEPPPWIVTAPGGGRPARPPTGRGRPALIVGAVVLAVLLVVAGGGYLVLWRYGLLPDDPAPTTPPLAAASRPVETTADPEPLPATEPAIEPTTAPAIDPEAAALDELDELSRQGLARASPHGQWVAQLASKNPGTFDKFQTTAGGSHTFTAADILAQYETLHDDPADGAVPVVLLKSTDYGKRQLYRGEPLYVTFALGDFATEQAVVRWCARRFPHLSGEELANQCAARRLRPGS